MNDKEINGILRLVKVCEKIVAWDSSLGQQNQTPLLEELQKVRELIDHRIRR